MFRAQLCAVLGFGLMLMAASTEARELELSIENRIGGDSNVLRRVDNEVDDGFYEFAPQVELREARNDELSYAVRYRPLYRTYFDTNGINGWDHAQLARLGWQITPRDSLTLNQSYSDLRTRRLDDGGLGDAAIDPTDRDRTKRARASASYSHGFSAVFFGQTGFEFEDFDFESNDTVDNRAYGGSLGATYAVHEALTLGLTTFVRYRDVRGIRVGPSNLRQPSTDNYVGSVSASISYALSPTIDFFIQAGPSIIRTDPDESSLSSETNLTFFAAGSLEKRWRNADVSVSYTRSESGGSGAVSSQILDAVDVEAHYRPYPDWALRVLGRWSLQKTASSFDVFVPGVGLVDTDEELERWRLVTSVDHRFTDRISVGARFEYTHQKEDQIVQGNQTKEVYTGFVSLRYTFEPWVF